MNDNLYTDSFARALVSKNILGYKSHESDSCIFHHFSVNETGHGIEPLTPRALGTIKGLYWRISAIEFANVCHLSSQ